MNYRDIIKNIQNDNFENIYLFHGREYYLIDNIIKVFKESLDSSMLDFNLDMIDGKEVHLDKIISSIETLPFMDDKKIVIVKDFELLKGKRKNFTETDEKVLIEHLDNIPDTTILVFASYDEVDKRKSLVKKIDKKGIVFNCDKLSDMDLFKWVKKKFQLSKVNIADFDIGYFIEQEGYKDKNSDKTLSDLQNEIKKISSFVGRENLVTREVIDKLSSKKVENDIFKLIDKIGQKRASDAIKIFNDMMYEGESPLGILAMLSKQFNNLIRVNYLSQNGYSQKEISESLKMHSFVVSKLIKQQANFNEDVILDILNYILECDYKIKNGLIKDTLAIEILISQYCLRDTIRKTV